ncbi:NADH-quinone oxidoreductase subunit C [Desulfonatronovibrio magnus]|uniref:NADH-quinone oxidoreductase subunit C n=1 Tax=Desulfonatronovibrio magnus TaxID=698827 RepID=UPI0005EB5F62|nr:NADH-quinone oxidoreductase subunit C [Desulfonatronovibrio magnus]
MTLKNYETISLSDLLSHVQEFKKNGYRFMAITALDYGHELELIYSFDHNLETRGVRLRELRDAPLQSISSIYFAAFLAENEIQDFYNVQFKDLIIDYQGHMFVQEEVRTLPYGQIKVQDKPGTEKEQ